MPTELAPNELAEVDLTLEHFNANHADTVLLLARFAAGCERAIDAEAVRVDTEGVDFEVFVEGTRTSARLTFDGPVSTAAQVSAQVMARIGTARASAGTRMPVTSLEEEIAHTFSLQTYPATVAAVSDISPNLREIVVEGAFEGFESRGQDQFVYVFVGRDADLPDGYSMADFMAQDPDDRPFGAYYTVRAWDPESRRITMWFALHGHADGVGGWAGRASFGDRLALWGPRPSFEAPADATTHLFVTDESGFAAVAARVEQLPADVEAIVIAETIDESHVVPLAAPGRADVRWIFRGDDEPGTGTGLIDAVAELDLSRPNLVAFGAAESRQVSAIRRRLRHEHSLPATHVSMTGYWRRSPH